MGICHDQCSPGLCEHTHELPDDQTPDDHGALLTCLCSRCRSCQVLVVSSSSCLRLIIGCLPLGCWVVLFLGGHCGPLLDLATWHWCCVTPLSRIFLPSIAQSQLWVGLSLHCHSPAAGADRPLANIVRPLIVLLFYPKSVCHGTPLHLFQNAALNVQSCKYLYCSSFKFKLLCMERMSALHCHWQLLKPYFTDKHNCIESSTGDLLYQTNESHLNCVIHLGV